MIDDPELFVVFSTGDHIEFDSKLLNLDYNQDVKERNVASMMHLSRLFLEATTI